ncbi:MAG: hypothetical protein RLY65_1448 [Pseudomonadota bacterium]
MQTKTSRLNLTNFAKHTSLSALFGTAILLGAASAVPSTVSAQDSLLVIIAIAASRKPALILQFKSALTWVYPMDFMQVFGQPISSGLRTQRQAERVLPKSTFMRAIRQSSAKT